MRRPIRTRRLLIAATVSLLLFVLVAVADIRSLWIGDTWDVGYERRAGLASGLAIYSHISSGTAGPIIAFPSNHVSGEVENRKHFGLVGFQIQDEVVHSGSADLKVFIIGIPLWLFLLVLLISPVRWLIARPANAPAFPVVTKQP